MGWGKDGARKKAGTVKMKENMVFKQREWKKDVNRYAINTKGWTLEIIQ